MASKFYVVDRKTKEVYEAEFSSAYSGSGVENYFRYRKAHSKHVWVRVDQTRFADKFEAHQLP